MNVGISPATATATSSATTVSMVEMVRVVVVMMPFISSLPTWLTVVTMLADLRSIDVEILNVFSLKSSLLKPLNKKKSEAERSM